MKKVISYLLIVLVFLLIISCSSKEMKDAKDFIALKDWKNALEKLDLEIKNNPKNIEAYELIYEVKFNLLFSDYSESNFLKPNSDRDEEFPEINEDYIKELSLTLDKINMLAPNKINPHTLFFNGLYNYYKWNRSLNAILNSEDILKHLDLYEDLNNKRCENEIYLSAISNFERCSNTKSDLSDNAYFWWYYLQCDSTFTDSMFVFKFKEKYDGSDLSDYVDLISFKSNTLKYLESIKDRPDSISATKSIRLINKFFKTHPNFNKEDDTFPNLVINYIVANNKSYISYDAGNEYKNSDGLIEYLNQFSKEDIPNNIKMAALTEIAEFYENCSKDEQAIKTYLKILNLVSDTEKQDEINLKIGKFYENSSKFSQAISYYEKVVNLTDMHKYYLWECYNEIGNETKAGKLRNELENSSDPAVSYLINLAGQIDDLVKLKISDLNAEFDDYAINISGYVSNNLKSTVYNVKVRGEVSDKNGNNTKQSFDYIDVIYPNKKSRFDISFYYGNNVPYSIKYGARIADYKK